MFTKMRNVAVAAVVAAAVPFGGVMEGIHVGHDHAVKDKYGTVHKAADEGIDGAVGGLGGLVLDAGAGVGIAYFKGRKSGKKAGYKQGYEAARKELGA